MSAESEIQARIILAHGSRADVRLFRNTVGEGWQGTVVHRNGDVVLRGARYVTFGLAPGSSDLIGWQSLLISPEHVGRTLAQFLAIEVKSATGRASADQRNFMDVVTRFGGCAGIARSPDDAAQLLSKRSHL